MDLTYLIAGSTLLIALLIYRIIYSNEDKGFFSGPAGLPLIGNVFQIPSKSQWLTYTRWSQKWGSLIHLRVFEKHIVVINNAADAVELLDNRSKIYSDRPVRRLYKPETISQQPYDHSLRARRKILHQTLSKTALSTYWHAMSGQALAYLQRLLEDPENFVEHIRRTVVSIILGITYGYEIKERTDFWFQLAEEHTRCFANIYQTHWSDSFPTLLKFPAWFPGVKYRILVRHTGEVSSQMKIGMYNHVKKSMAEGSATPSILSALLEEYEAEPEKDVERELDIRMSTGVIYAGGTDTSTAVVSNFFLAMAMNRHAQTQAQLEIDSVIGTPALRLPTFQDRERLPYVDALIKECMRWRPPLPLALPHACLQGDTYKGRVVPPGATVVSNIWSFCHDPSSYPSPSTFDPSRFIHPRSAIDPREYVFGFGRRICAGMNLANDMLFLIIVYTLAAFDINPVEEQGDVEYTGGILLHPESFKCSIKPRSERMVELIRQSS